MMTGIGKTDLVRTLMAGKVTFPAPSVNTQLVVIFFNVYIFPYCSCKKELNCGLIKPHAYGEKFSSWLSINQTNP
jgi:hypothetical protein